MRYVLSRAVAACLFLAACDTPFDVAGTSGATTPNPNSSVVARIEVAVPATNLVVGQSVQASAYPKDASGNVVADKPVVWGSSGAANVRISPTGVLTALAVGTATITATSGTVVGSAAITVQAAPTPPVPSAPAGAGAELPRVHVNSSMPTVTGRSIAVAAGGDLQAALNAAQPGDEIVLQAGATYLGGFSLPAKPGASSVPGTGPVIIVRTSAIASLPEGRRVSPADAQYMAKITTSAEGGADALGTAPGTAGWRLIGLEVTTEPNVGYLTRLVRFGDGSSAQSTAASVPSNIILDRSYVHVSDAVDIRRCIDLQSAATAIIESYIAGCHSANGDAQAIGSWNGPGPFLIRNNYLEGSGENVMFGGALVSVPGQLPSDIEIRGNYVRKPLTWKVDDTSYAGKHWTIKNLFEVKTGRRMLVEGNVFENTWHDAQTGFALLLKTEADQETQDITVQNNIIRGAAGGVNVAGTVMPIRRVAIRNNLFLDIGTPQWDPTGDNGSLFQAFDAPELTVQHNTGFAPHAAFGFDLPTSPNLRFLDNIVGHGLYGVKASGMAEGTASLTGAAPGFVATGNVLVGGGAPSDYPLGNLFAASIASVGFNNVATGDYALSNMSPYAGKASDGSDPGILGVDLLRATAGAKP